MTNSQIDEMLRDLVNEIDYDLFKEFFVYNERDKEALLLIVQKHLYKSR